MPFDVQLKPVVTGAHLKGPPWVPELRKIDGHEEGFLVLRREDRGLAAAMGRNCSEIRPFKKVPVFGYIAKLRDEKVDEAIRGYLEGDEAMLDVSAGELRRRCRERAFSEVGVSEVITVTAAPLTTPFGKRLEDMKLDVVATPRRGVNACVKLTPKFLEWLANVIDYSFDTGTCRAIPAGGRSFGHELPDLPPPLKYRKRGDAITVAVTYCDVDDRIKSHEETVTHKGDSQEQFLAQLPARIESVQKFVREHGKHVEVDDE